jgi:hypothetical protein
MKEMGLSPASRIHAAVEGLAYPDDPPLSTYFPEEAPTLEQRDHAAEVLGLLLLFQDPPENYEAIPLVRQKLTEAFEFVTEHRRNVEESSLPITWVHVLGAAKRHRYLLTELQRERDSGGLDSSIEIVSHVEAAVAAMADETAEESGRR